MMRIKNNFPISPPQGGRNSQRLMVSSEGDFYKMHLIIVYNLFGETKHLLRSWILSSSHHQPRGRREIYLTSYPTWLILSLCALRCTSAQHCVIYFESAEKVSETRAGAFSSHSLRLRPKHDWLNHSMNCAIARERERKSTFAWLSNIIAELLLISALYQSPSVHFFTPTCAQHIINIRAGVSLAFRSSQSATFEAKR